MKTTLLVVDDVERHLDLHLLWIDNKSTFSPVTAMTLDSLNEQYDRYRDELAGIILDGCLESKRPDTLPFIARVKADMEAGLFDGILMAASVDPEFREEMVAAGCTHEADKSQAAKYMLSLLAP